MNTKKIQVGDKIRWNVPIGGDTIYTILAIDTSRPYQLVGDLSFPQEILFQWQDNSGFTSQTWGGSEQTVNEALNQNNIIRVGSILQPLQKLPTFDLRFGYFKG